MSITLCPNEILAKIFSYTSPQDHCSLAQISRLFRTIADGDDQWRIFLEPLDPKENQAGNVSLKNVFRDNLLAIHPEYYRSHPKGEKLYQFLVKLPVEKLIEEAKADLIKAKFILRLEELYNKILTVKAPGAYLSLIAYAHSEAAEIILNTEEFYQKILCVKSPSHLLKEIAVEHPKQAVKILRSKKFYSKILGDDIGSTLLFQIARSSISSAIIILEEDILYYKLTVKDGENTLNTPLKSISRYHLKTGITDRETLLTALKARYSETGEIAVNLQALALRA